MGEVGGRRAGAGNAPSRGPGKASGSRQTEWTASLGSVSDTWKSECWGPSCWDVPTALITCLQHPRPERESWFYDTLNRDSVAHVTLARTTEEVGVINTATYQVTGDETEAQRD